MEGDSCPGCALSALCVQACERGVCVYMHVDDSCSMSMCRGVYSYGVLEHAACTYSSGVGRERGMFTACVLRPIRSLRNISF